MMMSHSLPPSFKKNLIVFPISHRCLLQIAVHGFFGMEVDESSCVFNGDARSKHSNRTQIHMISDRSVKNNSILSNGDLDPESFKKIFGRNHLRNLLCT
jgi:hypothetical protein